MGLKSLFFDLEFGLRGAEFVSGQIFHAQDQFVFARFDVRRHVDHVDEEIITTLARADIGLHGEDLLDDAFALGVADFVSPTDSRLVAFANSLARDVLEFAVEEYLLLGFEAIFIELVGCTESIDLGAEDRWADE